MQTQIDFTALQEKEGFKASNNGGRWLFITKTTAVETSRLQ